ncbi:MAG: AsmA family protein [Alphaproteobacteria bacterium]
MKRFVLFICATLFLLVATALIAPSFIDWNAHKDIASQWVSETSGFELDIQGDIGFTVLPKPRFYVEKASLKTPPQQGSETARELISLERLDINLALMPLFSKQIKVNALILSKPEITIERQEDGRYNIPAPGNKIKADTSALPIQNQESASDIPFDVSLDHVQIKEGILTYIDRQNAQEEKIQNINLELSAKSLQGPFAAQGSLFYKGYALNIESNFGRYDPENKIISSELNVMLQPDDIELSYNGVVSYEQEAGVSIQGQAGARIENIAKTLIQSGHKANIKSWGLKPVSLETKGLLTADANKVSFQKATVKLNERSLLLDASAVLNPAWSYDVTLTTPENQQMLLDDFFTQSYGYKKAHALNIKITGDKQGASLKDSSIALDNTRMQLSGAYENQKTKRPLLSLEAKINRLNADLVTKQNSNKAMPARSAGSLKAQQMQILNIPFDIKIKAAIEKLIWNAKEIRGVSLNTKTEQNKLTLDSFSIQNFGSARLSATATIKDIKQFDGINSYVTLESDDLKEVMRWWGMDTASVPENVKSAQVKISADGSLQSLKLNANANAAGTEFIASGIVNDIMGAPHPEDIEIQIKNNNMARALEVFGAVEIKDKNLHKPANLYAELSRKGDIFTFTNIKGDLAGTTAEGDLQVNLSNERPALKGKIDFGTLTLQSAMDANTDTQTAQSGQNAPRPENAPRWSRQAINTDAFHLANIDLSVSAKAINYGAWPLQDTSMNLKLKDGALDIQELKANVFGGALEASSNIQVANEYRAPIHFESTSTFKNVDLGQLFKTLIGTQLVNISGSGSLDMTLSSSGASPAALVYDLDGKGVVAGSDVVLHGIDVTRFVKALSYDTKPGDTVQGIWQGATKGGATAFETMSGAFEVQNGVVQINSMTLDGQTAKIETSGNLDLPRWTISTSHRMDVKIKNEELEAPPSFEIAVNGPLDNPSQTFGKGVLENYLKRKIQRKLDKILTRDQGAATNTQSPGAETPLESSAQPSSGTASPDIEDVAEEAIKGVLRGLLE